MARASLTVANSVIFLVIPDLFPIPQQLMGYAADDVMTTEAVDSVEVVMGIDGQLSAGWMPTPKRQTFTLQADSPSTIMFDAWQQSQEAIKDAYVADATISLPSIGYTYVCTKGFLTNYSPVPDARRILQPRRFTITWQSIIGAPL
jgi:hypothetical protein